MATRGREPCGCPRVSEGLNRLVSFRCLSIGVTVVLSHGALFFALQVGLLRRAVPLVVPVDVMVASTLLQEPVAVVPPLPPGPPTASQASAPKEPAAMSKARAIASSFSPPLVGSSEPAPTSAPRGEFEPPPAAAVASTSPPAQRVPLAPQAPPGIELPSSDAEYLHNPPPRYPRLSRQLGETGQVVVRVFIDANGVCSQAEIARTSGYPRLDQSALETARRWRYRPGKRAGVPEGMWFDVPIHFFVD